ncbi:TIGR04255 family protein [Virgibacillus sp. W0181]|uniref:TIGR04255 family protein n=1 Tax=Virgibacillus sp. W0181 TaxID=3391581 RepID=UPI003F487CFF
MNREVFNKAPVTEALLNIKVKLPSQITLATLDNFHEKIKNNYPYKRKIQTWEGGMEFNAKGAPKVDEPTSTIDGYIFKSVDGSKIVQARFDGLTFHMLSPYSEWKDFVEEAENLWNIYKAFLTPTIILQLGLRYINRIELPLPVHDLKEYLLTVPDVSSTVNYPLSGFFMRLVMKDNDSDAIAIVTETIDQDNQDSTILPIIFDTDVTINDLNLDYKDDFWEQVAQMRNFKNNLFFNSLTEKGKELFR